ncbi:pentapeptide repeat-containing protein [Ascidiimonas aurantiaca]|uniref:pentapeptide repeat-containing protein n=1 Tax=Ascidiimonas aurantiaca TaxID=1685432 RepID=UPI0030EC112B
MSANVIYDKKFTSIHLLPKGDYENCLFTRCKMGGTDLSGISFTECTFVETDLSATRLMGTALRGVHFEDCKMMGLKFNHCDPFLFSIKCSRCTLNFASFFQCDLTRSHFKGCRLIDVDFAEANLTEVCLDQCDLQGAQFENTLLRKCDFRTAYNVSLSLEMNDLKGARFTLEGLPGLLAPYGIEIE